MRERDIHTLDAEALWGYALKLLAGRAYSSGEFRDKLKRRAAREADVDAAIVRLKDLGYLNDQRFAENFAASRLAGEGFGKARVIRDLRQRRVAPPLAERSARKVYRDVNEQELIEDWIRRKYRTATREGLFAEQKDLAAAYRKLARAGFRTDEIVQALKRFARDPSLLDGFEPPDEAVEE